MTRRDATHSFQRENFLMLFCRRLWKIKVCRLASRCGPDCLAKILRAKFTLVLFLDWMLSLFLSSLPPFSDDEVAKRFDLYACGKLVYNVLLMAEAVTVIVISLPQRFRHALMLLQSQRVCEFLAIHHRIGLILPF